MKWQAKDIEHYLVEKNLLDTVVIPLIPVQWEETMLRTVREGEFTQVVSTEIERQLAGRVILHPDFTYLKDEDLETRFRRLETWKQQIINHGIKFVYFVTSDMDWKKIEKYMEKLIWMPVIRSEYRVDQQRQDYIEESVDFVRKIIKNNWNLSLS